MGHTVTSVKLYAADRSISKQVDLLVDTGSTYTWIPRAVLEEISVKPSTTRNFRTIDGRTLKRDVGEVLMECANERSTSMVVFADAGDANVLGVHALEGLGLEVDPLSKELRKSEALLALHCVTRALAEAA
jgi:clan AA aspartic protease